MPYSQDPDEPREPDRPEHPGRPDVDEIQALLFGRQVGPPRPDQGPTTTYLELDHSRRQRVVVRAAVTGVLIVVLAVVAVLLLSDGSDDSDTALAPIDAFECPGDPAPIAMVPVDDLVVDGIDATSNWLLVVDPLPELQFAWVRAADLDRSRTSLRVTACDRPPEPTPVPEPPAEPTPTPEPEPEPEPEPTPEQAPTPRDPSEVTVLVLNGARVEGLAGRVTDALAGEGFQTRTPDNADLQTDSQVFYAEGFAAEGELVALLLEIDPAFVEPQTDATPGGADVVVVLGAG